MQKGSFLSILASFLVTGLTVLLLIQIMVRLKSCQSKPGAVAAPTLIYADTTRVRLQHVADQANDQLLIVRPKTQQTVTTYEKSVSRFDSIRVALP